MTVSIRPDITRNGAKVKVEKSWELYLCISPAEDLMPRHNNRTMPARAIVTRVRVLVRNSHMARVGGSCPLADFQVMPPLGISMANSTGALGTNAITY